MPLKRELALHMQLDVGTVSVLFSRPLPGALCMPASRPLLLADRCTHVTPLRKQKSPTVTQHT